MKQNKAQAVQLGLLRECLPELENKIASVGVQTYGENGWVTGAYITNNAQISEHCQRTIYGPTTINHE